MHVKARLRWWAATIALCVGLLGSAASASTPLPAPSSSTQATQAEQDWLRQHPTLSVGVIRQGWPPYEVMTAGRVEGLSQDYLEAIAARLGVTLRPRVYADWPTLLEAACHGEVDVVMSVAITAARTRCLSFTRPYQTARLALVGRKQDAARLLSAPPHLRFAVERGHALDEALPETYADARTVSVADLRAALAAVADGRADAYIGYPQVVELELRRTPQPALAVLGPARLPPRTLHFATPHDRALLSTAIDRALAELPETRRAAIDRRWIDTRFAWDSETTALGAEDRQWLRSLPVLRVAFDPGWAPLTVRGADGAMSGILGDYLQRMQDQLGLRLQVIPASDWRSARALIAAGKADIAPASDDAGYGPQWHLTRPLVSFPCVIVTRRGADTVASLADLAGKRIATSDPDTGRRVTRALPDAIRVEVASDREGLQRVAERNVDAYVGNLAAVDNQLRDHAFADLHVAAPAGFSDHIGLAVREPYTRLAPLLDRVANDMGQDARQQIRRNWLKVDYDYGFARPLVWWSSAIALAIISLLVAAYLRLRAEIARRREADDRLREISRNLPAVVFKLRRTADGTYRFTYVTGNTRPLFGLDSAQIMADAESLFARIAEADQVLLREAFEQSARTLAAVTHDFHAAGAEDTRWISLNAVPRKADDGAVHWSGYWDDSTTLHAQNDALEHARAAAVEAAAARSEFLAVMSHEIRTPMAGLAGLLELLGRTRLDPAQRQLLATSMESATSLRQILDDVLDFSKAEAGEMQLESIDMDLREMASGVIEVSAPQARDKGLAIHLSIAPALAALHVGDPFRLRQVLLNLMGNALKFTSSGHVALSLDVAPRTAEPQEDIQQVSLHVDDTGIGIPVEQQAGLFRPFAQADTTTTRRHGGTGLGLSICRQLVTLMGGELLLHSTPGVGTRLSVRLALPVSGNRLQDGGLAGCRVHVDVLDHALRAEVHALLASWGMVIADAAQAGDILLTDRPAPTTPRSIVIGHPGEEDGTALHVAGAPLLPTHLRRALLALLHEPAADTFQAPTAPRDVAPVLVVEDHPTNQMLVALQLDALGYRHAVVGDGVAALRWLQTQQPSVVLTDISMPGMDGHALARHIREREAGRSRVPIIAMTANVLDDAGSEDLDAKLHKPVDLAELASVLARWVPASASPPAAESPVLQRLRERLGDDFSPLLGTFLDTTVHDRSALLDAIANDDVRGAARSIHRISGALGYFGYTELAVTGRDLSHALEQAPMRMQRTACEAFLHELDLVCAELDRLRKPAD